MKEFLQMSELFGVSTDYLLKDEMKAESLSPITKVLKAMCRTVEKVIMENANESL